MSTLVETLVTAFALSGLAATCLALLPQSPPRLRLAIAAAGLGAWLVPWGWLRATIPDLTLPMPFVPPVADTFFVGAAERTALAQPSIDASSLLAIALTLATLVGLALFAGDCVALRRSVRRWQRTSRPADELRSLLPRELAAVRARIRVVADSNVAAAAGCFAPTIWVGDRFSGERLRLVVIHETSHIAAHDPRWIASIALVRRVYWWNPLVAHLARQAILMIESRCDHRSAAHFDKSRYIAELASLVLTSAAPAPALIATVQTANLNVQRLRLLATTLRLHPRDLAVVAALGVCGAATAVTDVVVRKAAPAEVDTTTQVSAQAPVRRTDDDSDAALLDELLSTYAYTPQQHLGDVESDSTRAQ